MEPLAYVWVYLTAALVLSGVMSLLAKRGAWIYWLFVWPGVVVHEALHFIAGIASFARPLNFVFWPTRHADGSMSLGHVSFGNIRWFNGALVGLGPLVGFPLAVWLAHHAAHASLTLPLQAAAVYLLAAILRSSIPSIADIKLALRSWPLFIVAAFWHEEALSAMQWLAAWLRGTLGV